MWLSWHSASQPFSQVRPHMSRSRHYERNAAELREEMKKVDAELVELRKQVAERENERRGLADAVAALERIKLGTLPVTGMTPGPQTTLRFVASDILRTWGTLLDQAAWVLREAKAPMHIEEIVKRMQERGMQKNRPPAALRASLVSGLDRRIARQETFTKPQPATYGLREWDAETKTA